MARKKRN